jgi:hypothetical protein
MESVRSFLEGKLKLKVNEEKSKIGSPKKLKFLGFSLWHFGKNRGIRPHEKSVQKFREKVKKITKRNRGRPIKWIIRELNEHTRGWLGYYALADMTAKTAELNGWTRARLRMYIWKQWKKVRTRFANLQKAGLSREQAWMFANTRRGYWMTAHSPILTRTITNKSLLEMGYDDIAKRHAKIRKDMAEKKAEMLE